MARAQFQLRATVFDKRGRTLAVGHNSYEKTHPLQSEFAQLAGKPDALFLHAEIDALRKVKDWSKIHSIYVERYTKKGVPALAKPCKICERAIRQAGIKTVKFTH